MFDDLDFDPEDNVGRAAYNIADAQEGCRELNWLAAICLPEVVTFPFPPTYIYFWNRCMELATLRKGFPQLALGIPRGFAKTMFLKLLVICIILFTHRRYILVICASEQLAYSIISDIADALDHDNMRALFGNWDERVEINKADTKVFSFRGRTIILQAVGVGTSFRGAAKKFARPDVMIFDDAQTKDCAASIEQSKAFAEWMYGTAMKAGNKQSCFYLYVGNMYPKLVVKPATENHGPIYACMLRNLKDSPDWESIIVGAITLDGESLWEDLQSRDQLVAEYERDLRAGQEGVFMTEMMNDDDAQDFNIFDPSEVPDHPYSEETPYQGRFLIIDPSLGKKKSDTQVVGDCKVIDGRCSLEALLPMQLSAPDLVDKVIVYAIENNIPAIVVESYAYQASLKHWLDRKLDDLGISGINILLINRGNTAKASAILSMLKEVTNGDLLLAPAVRPIIYSEVRSYKPTAAKPVDDNLDVASYCNLIKNTYENEILVRDLFADYSPEIVDVGMYY